MKRSELLFAILLIPIDFIMLVLAGLSAYYLRVGSFVTEFRPVIFTLPVGQYMTYVLIIAMLWVIIFALTGLYSIKSDRRMLNEFKKIVGACSVGLLAIIVMIFLKRELFSSRFIILAAWGISILYVTIGRLIILHIQRQFVKWGIGSNKIIIIGDDKNTHGIIRAIQQDPKSGYTIIKHYPTFTPEIKERIIAYHKEFPIDGIIQTDPHMDRDKTMGLIEFCNEEHLDLKFIPDTFKTKTGRVEIKTIGGVPLFEVKRTRLEGWGRIYKRIFDIIGSVFAIIITSPVMFLTALAVKFDSKGPMIYKNQRVGKQNKHFNLYKFRRMHINHCTGDTYDKDGAAIEYEKKLIEEKSHREGPLYKITDDPRSTKVGKFIEKTSLDEFPQFFNVLRGNMSFVGPRPHQPREVEGYKGHHKILLAIKPGITGLAQISGRSDLDFEDEAKLDTFYIQNWSLWLDIQIIVKTPFVVIFKKRKK